VWSVWVLSPGTPSDCKKPGVERTGVHAAIDLFVRFLVAVGGVA
jgi:hypothetical protein